jgi:outer membrane biosynthesis protein TonB
VSERKQSAAASAAEKVRAILEAAEQSAAELRAEAAEEIDAQLERAQGVAARLSQRADQIERSLQGLADSLREELSTLKADLEELRAVGEGVTEKRTEAAERPPAEPTPAPESEHPPQPPTEPRPEPQPAPPTEPLPEPVPGPEPPAEKPAPAAAEPSDTLPPGGDGNEGARLIALNMALNGSPRDETARYLAENFEIEDPEALLDEVYARVSS